MFKENKIEKSFLHLGEPQGMLSKVDDLSGRNNFRGGNLKPFLQVLHLLDLQFIHVKSLPVSAIRANLFGGVPTSIVTKN